MKILSLISLVLFPTILLAQGSTCATMDPICTDVGASFTANTGTTAEPGNNYGCLITQPNPSWYYLEVATSGNIDMSLTAGSDIDFIIWGPYANLSAAQADCGSLGGNQIDCSYSATNVESPSISGAVAGQVYVMLITNYASIVQDITLVQTGGSGSTDCNIVNNPPCFMNYFEATIGVCNAATNSYSVTGLIEFDEPPTTGNLIVEDCDGNQTIVASAPFTVNGSGEGVYNFTFNGLDADGGACNIRAFFSADPTCALNLNYTAPECICNFVFQQSYNVEPCDIVTNTFDISGTLQFVSPPTTGFLTISDCNGNSVQYSPPFVSPFNFVLPDIPNIGSTNCVLSAVFTDDAGCNFDFSPFDQPNCACPVDIGTFTTTVTGSSTNSIMQCFNDEITIIPNGDFIPHDDQGAGVAVAYDPAIAMAVFSCPPTVGPPNSINADPCLLGVVLDDMSAGWTEVNVFGDNATFWYVPISMYNYNTLTYAIDYSGFICYDLGSAWELTSLAPIEENTVEDCFAGTATSTIFGGTPSFNGSNFSVVPGSLVPTTASFVNTTCANNGTITISGLVDGDAYSYNVVDENNCPITISGVFNGLQNATFSYNFKYCQDEIDPSALITGVPGGDFTSSPAGLVFLNTTTGLIDLSASTPGIYTIQYESPAATCWGTETFVLSINALPVVNATEDSPICDDGTSTIQLNETGGEATSWSWSSNGSATITNPTDQNPVVSNDAVSGEIFTVTATNVNTGCSNTDQVSVTVNPLENASFTFADFCVGATNTATITGTTGGTFAFNPVPADGATINPSTGAITNGVGGTTYTVEYTTSGACPDVSTEDVFVNPTPTVDPITAIEVCNGEAIAVTFTGVLSGTNYAWTNSVTTIGLVANGNGDIASFNGVNSGTTAVISNLTVTPSLNGCTGTAENFTITVNPTEDATFSLTDFCVGAINSATITGTTGGTFEFNPVPTDGATIDASTGAIANGVGGTTYTVEYTTSGACPDVSTQDILVNPTPTVDPITAIEVCNGEAIAVTFTGVLSGTNYAWTNSVTTIGLVANGNGDITSFNGVNSGTTAVISNLTVTPSLNGCTGTAENFTITVNPTEDASFTLTDFCVGATNSATITGTIGGTFAFNPVPIDGATIDASTGEISSGVEGTTYTLEYTTSGFCTGISTETVTVNPGPIPLITGDLQYCQGTSTVLSTTVVFADYLWSNGSTAQTSTVTIADNPITVQVTDALGCVGTSVAVNVSENNVFEYDSQIEICQGESVDIHGNMESTAGIYTQTFTLPTGCDSIANVTLIVNPLPNISAGLDETICNGESTTLTATGGVSYSWDNGLGVGNDFIISPIITTTYTVTGIDGNNCSNTDDVLITVNPLPTASIAGTVTICENDPVPSVTISGANGTAPYTFTYNINGGTDITVVSVGDDAIISVPASPSGVFNYNLVSVEDASATNCTQLQNGTATITINANPVPSIIGDADYCEGFTASISANQVYNIYDWSTGESTQTINVTSADNPIILTVTDASGCSGTSTIYNVIENPTPIIDAGLDANFCVGGSVLLSASGAVDYFWDNGVGVGNNFNVSPSVNTVYNVTGTDVNGCVGTDQIEVFVNDPPTATIIGTTTICENDPSPSITFTGANGTAPYTFTYNINGGPNLTVTSTGNTANLVVPNTPSGVYTYNLVSVEESSVNNCSQSQSGSAIITINSLPNVDAGLDQVACGNNQITLTASGAINYVWNNGVQNGVAFVPTTGVYTVVGTDVNGCINTDNVSVLVSPIPTPDFDISYTSCEPFVVTLTNTTPGVSSNCVWQISNGSAPIQGCGPIVLTMSQAGQYDVSLTTFNQAGCSATITELNAFSFEQAPIASFSPQNTVVSTLDTEISFVNNSTGADSYNWDFGDNTPNSNVTNPVHQYDENETENYIVTLIAYSNAGCSDTVYGYIRVEEEIIYYIPNTFTPDNDQFNQSFQPVFTSGYDPYDYTLLIFNRWGEIIFESHDVDQGWDGTYAGSNRVQDGTYTWKIEFKTTINDKRISKIGHVNVLR